MSIQEKESFKIIGAAHVVRERDGKICMLRRVNTGWMDGKYGFPAGHKETGESFLDCAIREVKEEAGVDVQKQDLEFVHMVHKYSNEDENRCRAEVFFVCRNWEGEPSINEPEKSDDLRWFSVGDLPDTVIPYLKTAVQNIQDGKYLTEIFRD